MGRGVMHSHLLLSRSRHGEVRLQQNRHFSTEKEWANIKKESEATFDWNILSYTTSVSIRKRWKQPWGITLPNAEGPVGHPCSPTPCLALAMGPAQGQVSRRPHTSKAFKWEGQSLGLVDMVSSPKLFIPFQCFLSRGNAFGATVEECEQKRHNLKTGFNDKSVKVHELPTGREGKLCKS